MARSQARRRTDKENSALLHTDNHDNPHEVTAEQLGLGNVNNVTTYSQAEIDSLLAGKANLNHDHDAGDIVSGTFADARISASSIVQHEAAITITEAQISDLDHYNSVDFDSDFATKTTDDLAEGSNLYYTQGRFDSAFSAKSTTDLSEGTNLYYTQGRFDSAFSAKSTTDLSEGSNLYFTDERVDDRVSNLLQEGSNITLTYDDVANTLTVASSFTNTQLTEEEVQDFAWNVLTGTQTLITVTYDDVNNNVDFVVEANLSNYTNDIGFLTSEVNDLTSAVTWANVPDANITQSSVTQHQAALTITESQISDLSHYTSGDFDTDFAGKSTTGLSEGTNLYFTNERVDDRVAALLIGGTNVSLTYDDVANSLTIDATDTDTQLTEEQVQDFAWNILTGTQTLITVTYDDANNNVDFIVEANLSNYTNDAGFITDLSSFSTTDLSEGTNLYYTAERARDDVGAALVGGTDISVTVDDPANTITIAYTGSGGGASSLDDLSDVTITTVSSGDFLRYNGTNFVNTTLSSGDLPSHTHTESDITDLGNYAVVGHTHTESDITDLGNYAVVGHSHSASDITSGQFADARMPASYNNSNWDTAYDRSVTNFTKDATDAGELIISRQGVSNLSVQLGSIYVGDARETSDFPNSNGSASYMPNPNDSQFNTGLTPIFSQDWVGPSYGGILTVKGWTADYAAWQIAGPAGTGASNAVNEFYVRSGDISAWNSWERIYTDAGGDINGPVTVKSTGGLTVEASSVSLRLNETDTTDENVWMYATGGSFQIQQRTDGGGFTRNLLNMDISADTIVHSGNFSTYGVPESGGTFSGIVEVDALQVVNNETGATYETNGTIIYDQNYDGQPAFIYYSSFTGNVGWHKFWDDNNLASVSDLDGVPASGGTFTGNITFNNDNHTVINLDRTTNGSIAHEYSIGVSTSDGVLIYNVTDSDTIAYFRHNEIEFDKELIVNGRITALDSNFAVARFIRTSTSNPAIQLENASSGNLLTIGAINSGNGYISPQGADGYLGIGTTSPSAELDVNGDILADNGTFSNTIQISNRIIAGGGTPRVSGDDLIEFRGSTSSAILGVQDGNGRMQLKWNASEGTSETYLVSSEQAFFWDINVTSSPIWEMKYAGSGTAGNAISWSTLLSLSSSGDVTANDFIATSDARIKSNEIPITNALESLRDITPYHFDKNGERKVGYIAQNVEEFTENVVSKIERGDYSDFRVMNMFGMQAYNTAAIKEVDSEVQLLKNKVEQMQKKIKTLEAA